MNISIIKIVYFFVHMIYQNKVGIGKSILMAKSFPELERIEIEDLWNCDGSHVGEAGHALRGDPMDVYEAFPARWQALPVLLAYSGTVWCSPALDCTSTSHLKKKKIKPQ